MKAGDILVIGIDLDDTLVETTKEANKKMWENEKYKNIKDFHMLNKKEYNIFLKKHIKSIQENANLKENALEVLNWLKENNVNIVIITARGSKNFDFLIPITDIYLKNNKVPYDDIIYRQTVKGKTCKKYNVDLFIDDKEEVLDDINKYGIKVLKMNNNQENSKYITVNNWLEIKQYIQDNFNF